MEASRALQLALGRDRDGALADPGESHGVLTPLKSVGAPKLGIGYTPCS